MNWVIFFRISGKASRGKKTLDKNIIGIIITFNKAITVLCVFPNNEIAKPILKNIIPPKTANKKINNKLPANLTLKTKRPKAIMVADCKIEIIRRVTT